MCKLQLHPQLSDETSDTAMLDTQIFSSKVWQTKNNTKTHIKFQDLYAPTNKCIFVKLGTFWKIREPNFYRPSGAHSFAHAISTDIKQVVGKRKKGRKTKKERKKNNPNFYLLSEHIKHLTSVPTVTTNHMSNKHERFLSNRLSLFLITERLSTFLLSACEKSRQLSPLNICSLNWRFRRGTNNWCCLKRCHRATTRTMRFSSYLTWLPNKKGLPRWILSKKNKAKPLILSHTSFLGCQFHISLSEETLHATTPALQFNNVNTAPSGKTGCAIL